MLVHTNIESLAIEPHHGHLAIFFAPSLELIAVGLVPDRVFELGVLLLVFSKGVVLHDLPEELRGVLVFVLGQEGRLGGGL